MSSVHVKCITKYTREASLACECTHTVLRVLVKCVLMHARTFFEENACTCMPKLQVKANTREIFSNSTQKAGESMCVFTCECKVKLELYHNLLANTINCNYYILIILHLANFFHCYSISTYVIIHLISCHLLFSLLLFYNVLFVSLHGLFSVINMDVQKVSITYYV